MPQQNAIATADAKAGEATEVTICLTGWEPGTEAITLVTNLDLVKGRCCVVNDYAGEPRVCATE